MVFTQMSGIVNNQEILTGIPYGLLIGGVKMISVENNPVPFEPSQDVVIPRHIVARKVQRDENDACILDALAQGVAFATTQEDNMPARSLPALGERKAPHDVSCAHASVRVGPDDHGGQRVGSHVSMPALSKESSGWARA